MIKGDYKKVLWQIFDVLGLTESEKEYGAEKFKKHFAADLLKLLQERLSQEHKNWIDENLNNQSINSAKALEIQSAIRGAFTGDEIDKLSYSAFKAILIRYSSSISQKLGDTEKVKKINSIAESF